MNAHRYTPMAAYLWAKAGAREDNMVRMERMADMRDALTLDGKQFAARMNAMRKR